MYLYLKQFTNFANELQLLRCREREGLERRAAVFRWYKSGKPDPASACGR